MSAVVSTPSGSLEGLDLGTQLSFRGIPFAQPPVGALRWRAPEPVSPWSGTRNATRYGDSCTQSALEIVLPMTSVGPTSEDCLNLNVSTPALDGARRPVMVWIHGGGFMVGCGHQNMPEEQSLVTRGDVVLVSVNYRLGPFGFLNLDDTTGGRIPSSGNEGLLDQVAALTWVRDHIEAFGGDPENVTIFGESAGGMSVGALLALPAARGLFHKAIPQSGACHTANSPEVTRRIGARVVEVAGTDDPDALLAFRSDQVLALQTRLLGGEAMQGETAWEIDPQIGSQPFQPCIDGKVLPELPFHSVAKGAAAGVPVLCGSTLDEYKAFAYDEPSLAGMTDDVIRERLGHVPALDGLIASYREGLARRGASSTALDVFAAIGSDRQFRIPAIRLCEAQLEHDPRVFHYLYTWASPVLGGDMGATHGIELGPLFGVCELDEKFATFFGSGPAAAEITAATQAAWIAFARNGNPSCEEVGDWPAYSLERRETMLLGRECAVEAAPYDAERRAWDTVPHESIGEY